jgi:hypothetical protein
VILQAASRKKIFRGVVNELDCGREIFSDVMLDATVHGSKRHHEHCRKKQEDIVVRDVHRIGSRRNGPGKLSWTTASFEERNSDGKQRAVDRKG